MTFMGKLQHKDSVSGAPARAGVSFPVCILRGVNRMGEVAHGSSAARGSNERNHLAGEDSGVSADAPG